MNHGASASATLCQGRVGVGRAFGSFGELVQGVLPGDRDFLVTLPLDSWSTATFRHTPGSAGIRVVPAAKRKASQLARLALDAAGVGGGGTLEVRSELPEGKGLASSSADLVAVARAVAAAAGVSFDHAMIESLLRCVEPSDGVLYDGIVAFCHREVRLLERLGSLPELVIIAHDEGGQVDTITYTRTPTSVTASDKREYARLLAELGAAIRARDLAEVGRIATRSAVLSSRRRPRRELDAVRDACADVDGFGVVLAHSGTMLGILLAGDDPLLDRKVERVRDRCGSVSVYRTLSTGD